VADIRLFDTIGIGNKADERRTWDSDGRELL